MGNGFLFDAKADGRFCPAIRVGRRCKANDVVAVLEELTSLYPAPAFIRSDNGPEFIAQALQDWCEASTTTTSAAYIAPGSPWENGFAESFNSRFQDVLLNRELQHDHTYSHSPWTDERGHVKRAWHSI